ncbi:MAG: F0F1 ATP synthase subunit A, partial [Saprospiraceae bacterium]
NRIADPSLPSGALEIQTIISKKVTVGGKEKEQDFAIINGIEYALDKSSTADGGLFGGGLTSFYDFSITKNVFSMLFVFLLLSWVFLSMAKNYKKAPGTAPKGAQLLMEPLVIFIQEEVAKPFLGPKWERFLPMLLSIFFFVLGLNLFGQIPFLGGSNVTGNLSFTMVLALIAFIVVNFNGNKHYWEHIFWMPGIPAWVKIILTPVEVLGVLIKPLTLMLRLFANITAGHMAILIFISLIFIFGNSGASTAAGLGASIGSGLLTVFMMSIELLVAMIQAFVFTLLTASYIGAATEEHHHAEH